MTDLWTFRLGDVVRRLSFPPDSAGCEGEIVGFTTTGMVVLRVRMRGSPSYETVEFPEHLELVLPGPEPACS